MQVKLAVLLRKDSGSPSEAHSHRFGFVPIQFSSGKGRVVIGPDHGPRVDVEQGTARARLALTIAHAQLIARVLAAVHASGDGAVVPGWNQRQLTHNVRDRTTYTIGSGDGHCHNKCQCA